MPWLCPKSGVSKYSIDVDNRIHLESQDCLPDVVDHVAFNVVLVGNLQQVVLCGAHIASAKIHPDTIVLICVNMTGAKRCSVTLCGAIYI